MFIKWKNIQNKKIQLESKIKQLKIKQEKRQKQQQTKIVLYFSSINAMFHVFLKHLTFDVCNFVDFFLIFGSSTGAEALQKK